MGKIEIKFRAWDGKSIITQSKRGEYDDFYTLDLDGTFYGHTRTGDEHFDFDKSDKNRRMYVLMQYTGLKDKNGKEIYEGDIGIRCLDLKKVYTDGKTWRDYWVVEWHTESAGFVTRLFAEYNAQFSKVVPVKEEANPYSKRFNEIQIIGNIYENPELML